jgi:hypothetical protein
LAAYVQQGGGLGVVPPGEELDAKAYNSAVAQKVLPAKIVKQIELPEGTRSRWDLVRSSLRHPFLSLYAKWLSEADYDLLRVPSSATQYWEVKPRNDEDILVRYDDKEARPAIVGRQTNGKVLLLTTPMDARQPAWNNYGEELTSFYLALTMMCARHLCPDPANAQLNFEFGPTPPIVNKGTGMAFPKYLVSSADFSEEIRFDDKNRWVGDRLPRAGNYTVSGTDPGKQQTVAVHNFSINVSAEESDLGRVPISEMESVMGKDAVVAQDRKTPLGDTLSWDEPLELFPWLMIGLLFLLALENLLANKFYRQEPRSIMEDK